jgi:hypothetical protein
VTDADLILLDAIDRYGLHASGAPVDLSPLEEVCPVAYEALPPGCAGFTVATAPATRDRPATVVLDRSLGPLTRRIAYAHEAAHGLLGHAGNLALRDMDPWFQTRQERDAWRGAALLLVPQVRVDPAQEVTIETVARACDVPKWIVERLPKWWWGA